LSEGLRRQSNPAIQFSELRNDLGNGYRSQVLYGANTGQRSWSLTFESLADTSVLPNTVTSVNGETVSRENYLWDLYCDTRVTGNPFVYTCPRNGRYYLVDFADQKLQYEKQMLVKLYSTGVELEQVRLDGESVFQVGSGDVTGVADFNEAGAFGAAWIASALGTDLQEFAVTGNVTATGTQNGLRTTQFNVGATDTGFLLGNGLSSGIREAWFVMKMREDLFSNLAGVFTATATDAVLVGATGTNTFFNFALTNFEYRFNDTLYPQTNMVAPMNDWGIVHVRKTDGTAFFAGFPQVGKDRNFAGRFAEMDVAEMVFSQTLLSVSYRRELLEHLVIKWGL
jgi:hypothetical protein